MNHYTIQTCHNRVTHKSEIDTYILSHMVSFIERMLSSNDYETIPYVNGGYFAKARNDEDHLVVNVNNNFGEEIVIFDVVLTKAKVDLPVKAPCIIADLRMPDMEAYSWLADFERCIGWAWEERCVEKAA